MDSKLTTTTNMFETRDIGIVLLLPIMVSIVLVLTIVFAHENYSNSKGCMRTDKIDSYWFDNVCKHIPLPRLVAVTGPGHCYGETCQSGGWIPIRNGSQANIR